MWCNYLKFASGARWTDSLIILKFFSPTSAAKNFHYNYFLFRIYRPINAPLLKFRSFSVLTYTESSKELTHFNDFDNKEMVKILNVAEKNDAAKHLAEFMSRGRYRLREGFSRYNKIYEYDYFLFNQQCAMIMTSVSGHLLNYEFVGSYRKWQSCNPLSLFEAPVALECPLNYLDIKKTLEREIRNCSKLIIWTDCDREGENIGFEIIDVCKKVKSNISIHRAKFSEITSQAVVRACQALCPPDSKINSAVNVRRELDLRIGAAFTRFQTMRLKRVFPEVLEDQLISYGSCQFPTLGFVVERYKQVQNFIPEQFWTIKVMHKKEEISANFSWKRHRLFDHTACLVLFQRCLENPIALVTDVKSKNKSKWRPNPLDTVEMEKIASRKLHISAKEALQIAEKLYTQGYISYPRTETNIFPKDIDLSSLVQLQIQDQQWGAFASGIFENGPNPRQGNKSDNAHPPIHPIKYADNLQGNEKRLYEFIVRHFLACLSADAQGRETIVEIDINDEHFSINGLIIIARNYLDVYPYDRWNAKIIPLYEVDETFHPNSIEMTDGETSPPQLLTEADLIALMEKHGIGTDATHAEHIEKIKSRLYVGLNNEKRFVPGELGMGLVEGYDMMGFEMSKPHLRAELESDLKRICEGTKNPNVVLEEQIRKYKEVFIEAVNQANKIDEALSRYFGQAQILLPENEVNELPSPVMKCPKCGSADITLKSKKDNKGFFLGCLAYPNCNGAIWLPECIEQVVVDDSTCDECLPRLVHKLKFKFKRNSLAPFYPDEYVGCLGGCNPNLLDALNVRQIASSVNEVPNSIDNRVQTASLSHSTNRRADSGYESSSSRGLSPSIVFGNNINTNGIRPSYSNVVRNNTGSQDVMCLCGEAAKLLTVKKEGPNSGRQFYKCSKSVCNFFLWADDGNPSAHISSNFNSFHPGPGSGRSFSLDGAAGTFNQEDSIVMCHCSAEAKMFTVQKEGPNKGRQFYSCPKPPDLKCKFFKWSDESSRSNSFNQAGTSGQSFQPQRKVARTMSEGHPRTRKCGNCGQEGHDKRRCPLNR